MSDLVFLFLAFFIPVIVINYYFDHYYDSKKTYEDKLSKAVSDHEASMQILAMTVTNNDSPPFTDDFFDELEDWLAKLNK